MPPGTVYEKAAPILIEDELEALALLELNMVCKNSDSSVKKRKWKLCMSKRSADYDWLYGNDF